MYILSIRYTLMERQIDNDISAFFKKIMCSIAPAFQRAVRKFLFSLWKEFVAIDLNYR